MHFECKINWFTRTQSSIWNSIFIHERIAFNVRPCVATQHCCAELHQKCILMAFVLSLDVAIALPQPLLHKSSYFCDFGKVFSCHSQKHSQKQPNECIPLSEWTMFKCVNGCVYCMLRAQNNQKAFRGINLISWFWLCYNNWVEQWDFDILSKCMGKPELNTKRNLITWSDNSPLSGAARTACYTVTDAIPVD